MKGVASEMVTVIDSALHNREKSVAVARAIARYFGGQLLYVPLTTDSKHVERLRDLIADEVGDGAADQVIFGWLQFFGCGQLYVPLEHVAFRDEIADEIYEQYDGTNACMADLCREHRTSFAQIYRLYHRGRARRLQGPTLFD